MNKQFKNQRGISLLELLLALVIIIVFMLSVFRYYQTTNLTSLIKTSIDDIQVLNAASQSWWQDRDHSFSDLKSINDLVTGGYIIKDKYQVNAWGGDIDVKGISAQQAQITLKQIPTTACNNILRKFHITNITCATSIGPSNKSDFVICINGSGDYENCSNSQ